MKVFTIVFSLYKYKISKGIQITFHDFTIYKPVFLYNESRS